MIVRLNFYYVVAKHFMILRLIFFRVVWFELFQMRLLIQFDFDSHTYNAKQCKYANFGETCETCEKRTVCKASYIYLQTEVSEMHNVTRGVNCQDPRPFLGTL